MVEIWNSDFNYETLIERLKARSGATLRNRKYKAALPR